MLPERRHYLIEPMPMQISPAQREALLALDTPTIGHHLESGFMDQGIVQQTRSMTMAGTAVTVRITLPDSVMAHYALKFVRPGDILVVDRGQDQRTACWGAATTYAARAAGLSGVLIDGATTDVADADKAGLPMWSRGVSPVTTKYRGMGGEMNVPVSCGGVAISPGDAILADANGVVVIRPDEVDEVIAAAQAWMRSEQEFLETLRKNPGLCYPDVTGASTIVEARIRTQQGEA